MLKHGSIFIVLLCFLELGTGLYFHIGETERKCFIEEIPDDTTVIVCGNIRMGLHKDCLLSCFHISFTYYYY
ncbi:hypothetical protein DMN91_008099 [Ooceraea biroi]|uniref:Uncharacterized protein n=1 Tax=Ooceraea biroi TaxID=2015173 RepID=A0A3L8DH85_OOCBI|nr:hypothetical protein DMN91_008099 [Ooceraea biroi]